MKVTGIGGGKTDINKAGIGGEGNEKGQERQG